MALSRRIGLLSVRLYRAVQGRNGRVGFMQTRQFFAAFLVLALLGSCAGGRTADTRRGVMHAASQPFRDVGLIRPDIPPILAQLQYPYQRWLWRPGARLSPARSANWTPCWDRKAFSLAPRATSGTAAAISRRRKPSTR